MKNQHIEVLVFTASDKYEGPHVNLVLGASPDRKALGELQKRLEKAARKAMRDYPVMQKKLKYERPTDKDLADFGFQEEEFPVARAFWDVASMEVVINFEIQQARLLTNSGA